MKRFLSLLLISVMLITSLSLTACGNKKESDTFTFVLGFDAEFPPYGYRADDGSYVGFDIDLAKEVCKRNGWELKLTPIAWDEKDFELESNAISCIWNGFTMNGREALYTWTESYMDNSQVFVTKKSSNIQTFADLAGKIVTVQKDSSCESALNDEEEPDNIAVRDSFKKLNVCADYNTAFTELDAGAIDAIGMDIGVAKFQIAGREDEFVIMDQVLVAEQYGVGFKLGNTELRDKVMATLKEMVSDGTFEKISLDWFGYNVCTLKAN